MEDGYFREATPADFYRERQERFDDAERRHEAEMTAEYERRFTDPEDWDE